MSPTRILGFLTLVSIAASGLAAASDWPQWRGPSRDGISPKGALPDKWPAELVQSWEAWVGEGHSSPLAADGRVFVLSRKGANEVVSAFRLDGGKRLWQASYAVPFNINSYATMHGSSPKSTPLHHEGKLFTIGISGILSAFRAEDGKLLWRRDFSDRTDTSNLFCGASASPLMVQGKLIVHVGDDRAGELLALDPSSGAESWSWKGDKPAYASPILARFDGVPQIVILGQTQVSAVDPVQGKGLWSLPFEDKWLENIVTPVHYRDTLILSGVRRGSFAVRPKRDGERWRLEQVWEDKQVRMYMSTPVLIGDRLYGMMSNRKGQFFCMDPASGKLIWTSEGREGENASVIAAGDRVLFVTTQAVLTVVNAGSDEYRPLDRRELSDSPVWAHPALTTQGLLIKDKTSLRLWGVE